MSNVNAEIKWQGNNNAWFTANGATVYPANIQIFHTDGRYKFTDGVTDLATLPFRGDGGSSTLQQVITESSEVTGTVYSSADGNSNVFFQNEQHQTTVSNGTDQVIVEQTPTSFNKNGIEIATNGEGAAIASASVVDLGVDGNSLYHITGSTTITSFSNLPAGVKKTIVFDGSLIITASSDIILPGDISMVTGAGDNAIVIGEGGGVVRFLTYFKFDESYTNYTPSFTGFSVAPTVTAGDWRWKMLTKNTFHLIGWATSSGTSNSTATTVTSPFNLAWTGGSGFGLQQPPCVVVNNGSQVIGTVRSRTGNSNILDVYVAATGAFTASGNKNVFINAVFQVAL